MIKQKQQEFAKLFIEYAASCSSLFTRFSQVVTIINPAAGGFSNNSLLSKNLKVLKQLEFTPNSENLLSAQFTRGPGHAAQLVKNLITQGSRKDGPLLIITAGGDGTGLDAVTGALKCPFEQRKKAVFFELPLGTGNDGASAESFPAALEILKKPGAAELARCVMIQPNNCDSMAALNIASIGLDAYVVVLTNSMKKKIPGDFYKAMVDIATLFYEPRYGVGKMKISMESGGNSSELEGRFILTAFGASGYRSYGSGKKVLPGKENLCAVETVGLCTKLKMREKFYAGSHVNYPFVQTREADTITIEYNKSIPIQMDGEAFWLGPENFPLTMSVNKKGYYRLTVD
ncbi:MAG: diacylglycerol/lipid kinase family protein [Spirochaetia bacterium]